MNRIFLAILALFAGIAAQVSPAEARVRGETEVGSVLSDKAAARVAAAVRISAPFCAATGFDLAAELAPACARTERADPVPTVLIGSDRAHE